MMKRLLVIAISFFLAIASYCQSHYCLKIGNASIETSGRPASAPSGTTFQCGTSTGKLKLNTCISEEETSGIYLSAIDKSGTAMWLKKFTYAGYARASALDVHNNSLFLCGEFEGSLTIDTLQLISNNAQTAFVAEFDTLGNVKWAAVLFSSGNMNSFAVRALPQGGCLLGGAFEGSLGINDMMLLSEGGSDYFLIEFSSTGATGYFTYGGSTTNDAITSIQLSNDGMKFIGGYFGNNANLGGTTYLSQGESDAFIAKINPQNTWEWTKRLGSSANDQIRDLCLHNTKIAATGFIGAFTTVDGIELSPLGASDALLWIVNQETGVSELAKIYGDSGEETGTGICSSATGNLFLAGEFSESFYADAQMITHQGLTDGFVFELNGGYFLANARLIGSSGNEHVSGIAEISGNSCHVAGTFEKHCSFGQAAMSATQTDSYCMSFNQETTAVPGLLTSYFNTANSGLSSNNIKHLSVDAQNRIWVSTADSGLSVYDGTTWIGYHSGNSPLPNEINSTFHAADGKVYIGTPSNGLFVYDGSTFVNYNTTNSQIGFDNINSITSKNPSIIWMGTPDSGLVRLNPVGFGQFNTGNSLLGSNTVRELDYDTSGGTWVATLDGGISRFFAGNFSVWNTQNSNLPGDSVVAVHTDKFTNTTYAITNNSVSRFTGTDWVDEDLGADFMGIPINDFTTTPSAYVAAGGKKKGGHIRTPIVQRTVNTDNILYENEVVKVLADTGNNTLWMATQATGLIKIDLEITTNTGNKDAAGEFLVQPNPAQRILQVPSSFSGQLIHQVDVFDAQGRKMISESILTNPKEYYTLHIENLPVGMYFIKAWCNNGNYTSRFLKIGQ